jgi:hypothetical protein
MCVVFWNADQPSSGGLLAAIDNQFNGFDFNLNLHLACSLQVAWKHKTLRGERRIMSHLLPLSENHPTPSFPMPLASQCLVPPRIRYRGSSPACLMRAWGRIPRPTVYPRLGLIRRDHAYCPPKLFSRLSVRALQPSDSGEADRVALGEQVRG